MNTEQKLFDLSFLEQMDDKNFITEIITLYLKDTGSDLEKMKQASDEGDLGTIHKIAHKLKSSTGLFQANTLFNILENMEKTAKEGVKTKMLEELVKTAQDEFNQLKPPLKMYLQGI
jgi:HPt (histidine-containing phosphotransfer) domain-containing protein